PCDVGHTSRSELLQSPQASVGSPAWNDVRIAGRTSDMGYALEDPGRGPVDLDLTPAADHLGHRRRRTYPHPAVGLDRKRDGQGHRLPPGQRPREDRPRGNGLAAVIEEP